MNVIIGIVILLCFIVIGSVVVLGIKAPVVRILGLCFATIGIVSLLIVGIWFPKNYAGECVKLPILERSLLQKHAVLVLSNGEVIVVEKMKFLTTLVIYKCEVLNFIGGHKDWVYDTTEIEKKNKKDISI